MGWLSALGKIAQIGSLAAAPFTGGASLAATGALGALGKIGKVASAAGDIGSVLGKQQAGAAAGKEAQANLNQGQDRNAISLYQAQQGAQNNAGQLDLQRKAFTTSDRGNTAKQALIGALLGGRMQGTKIGPGGASGGLLASLNGNPEALAAMKLMASQAGGAQASPLAFTGGEMVKAPSLTKLPQVDKGGFLSTLANIGQLAGAAAPYLPKGGDDGGNGASRPFVQAAAQLAGVTPFGAIPKAKLLDPYGEEDWSNR